jgi:hypothetical protein
MAPPVEKVLNSTTEQTSAQKQQKRASTLSLIVDILVRSL